MNKTNIPWANYVWNPMVGCSKVSKGCANCYAEVMAKRLAAMGRWEYANVINSNGHWNDGIQYIPDRLDEPGKVKMPSRVFVDSMGDLFHENADFHAIQAIFYRMFQYDQHEFLILTKRLDNMVNFWRWWVNKEMQYQIIGEPYIKWPLDNVWLGASVEDQITAMNRIPLLLEVPAKVHFISAEPLLGGIDLEHLPSVHSNFNCLKPSSLDWVICGGENAPAKSARTMEKNWAVNLWDQCHRNDIPFYFKGWGSQPDPSDHGYDDFTLRKVELTTEWPPFGNFSFKPLK